MIQMRDREDDIRRGTLVQAMLKDIGITVKLDKARHRLDEERRRANETLVRYMRDHALHVPLLNPSHDSIVSKRVVDVKVHKNSMDWINDAWLRE